MNCKQNGPNKISHQAFFSEVRLWAGSGRLGSHFTGLVNQASVTPNRSEIRFSDPSIALLVDGHSQSSGPLSCLAYLDPVWSYGARSVRATVAGP